VGDVLFSVHNLVFTTSIDKAAQAAAQAAQTAALETHMQHSQVAHGQHSQQKSQVQQTSPPQIQSPPPQMNVPPISPEQALDLVQKLGLTRFLTNPEPSSLMTSDVLQGLHDMNAKGDHSLQSTLDRSNPIDTQIMLSQSFHSFSPFSQDPDIFPEFIQKPESSLPSDSLLHQSENGGSALGDAPKGANKSGNQSPRNSATVSQNVHSISASTQRMGPPSEGSASHLVRSSNRQDAPRLTQLASPARKTSQGREGQAEHEK
jgi:hypothetical protein